MLALDLPSDFSRLHKVWSSGEMPASFTSPKPDLFAHIKNGCYVRLLAALADQVKIGSAASTNPSASSRLICQPGFTCKQTRLKIKGGIPKSKQFEVRLTGIG